VGGEEVSIGAECVGKKSASVLTREEKERAHPLRGIHKPHHKDRGIKGENWGGRGKINRQGGDQAQRGL